MVLTKMITHPTFRMVDARNGAVANSHNRRLLQYGFDNFDTAFMMVAAVMITAGIAVILHLLYQFCIEVVAIIGGTTIATSEDKAPLLPPSSNEEDATPNPLKNHVVPDSEREGETIDIFIGDILRERPVSFSPQQIEELIGNPPNILGSGGHGVVYKGMISHDVPVAVKVLKNNSDKIVKKQFMAEVGTIGRTYHVNLVRLYGFCSHTTKRAIVYEYMPKGSLDKVLFGKNEYIEWEMLHEIAIGTAEGIAYLHEGCPQSIIHYDIKPGNVLLDANLNPRVADFGLAKLRSTEGSDTLTGCRGTPGYQAPELGKPYPVTHKCDVYSFGKMLFEIVARRRNHDPNKDESQEWLTKWTWDLFTKGELSVLLCVCGIEEKNRRKAERMLMVALWCIQHLPEARPSMSDVVKMLEGVMEIVPPPNPFENSESGPSAIPKELPYGKILSNSSSSSTEESDQASSKATGEIQVELAEC